MVNGNTKDEVKYYCEFCEEMYKINTLLQHNVSSNAAPLSAWMFHHHNY
jgi:hypothetical protein